MPLTVLGIESSCDDTAAAVVTEDRRVLSSVVSGQAALHAAFGGVVPEIAARAHAERLDLCVEAALEQAGVGLRDLDAIAVTAGPGLIGGVMAGVMLAKGLSAGTGLPLVGVNHLAGHALTPRLTDGIGFPYLMLLVSGGHCQFLRVSGPEEFTRLGGTIDDAPGEAFDKVAKLLGLPQPGGPVVEAEAAKGDAAAIPLPRPLLDRPGCDMSFSGLKTAVLRVRDQAVAAEGGLRESLRADIARGLPTALTLACADGQAGHRLQHALSTPVLRLYRTTDVTGAELGGALKNVIAIAAGVAIGAGLGDSARAAIITRGFAEMTRFAAAKGADPETLTGLSGLGDLILTATSEQSRNFRYGLALGRAEAFDPHVTVEGAATARAVAAIAARTGIEMPVSTLIAGLAGGRVGVKQAVELLLARPLKEE